MLRWLSTVLVVTWPATALAGLPAGAERTAPRQRVDPLLATTVGAYSLAGTALVVGNVTAALSMAADADAEERCASLGVGAGSGCAAAEADRARSRRYGYAALANLLVATAGTVIGSVALVVRAGDGPSDALILESILSPQSIHLRLRF